MFAGDPVPVAVEIIDVTAGDIDRALHISGPFLASPGAIDIGGNGHTGAGIVGIAVPRCDWY